MGLLGKLQNITRHAIADALQRGREQHENSLNNKLKRLASNIDNPLAAGALKVITKVNDLAEIPFRKANMYLNDKLKPVTTDKSMNHDVKDSTNRADHLRKLLNSKRMTPTEYLISNQDDNKNEIQGL